jgi:hypothetical protein
MAIWVILWPFDIFYPVSVCCTKINLATLVQWKMPPLFSWSARDFAESLQRMNEKCFFWAESVDDRLLME